MRAEDAIAAAIDRASATSRGSRAASSTHLKGELRASGRPRRSGTSYRRS
jgi:hypothetical protein